MKAGKRFITILLSITLVSAFTVMYFLWQSNGKKERKFLHVVKGNADLQVRDVLYTDVGKSGLKWEVRADTAQYMRNENVAHFEKIRVKLVLSDGKTIFLQGEYGKLYTDTKDMELTGKVEIVSDRGDRLVTDVLKYSGKEQRFYTDMPVYLENAGLKVKGVGMSLSLQNRDVALLSQVKAIVP